MPIGSHVFFFFQLSVPSGDVASLSVYAYKNHFPELGEVSADEIPKSHSGSKKHGHSGLPPTKNRTRSLNINSWKASAYTSQVWSVGRLFSSSVT